MTLLPLCAQNDSIAPAVKERRWDKREHLRYDERWERLKPTHLKCSTPEEWDSTQWRGLGLRTPLPVGNGLPGRFPSGQVMPRNSVSHLP